MKRKSTRGTKSKSGTSAKRQFIRDLTPAVEEISKINLSIGGVVLIPHAWHKRILTIDNKPHPKAVTILADIVYWHRLYEVRDEVTGEVIEIRKKFSGAKFQLRASMYTNLFGWSKREVQAAVVRLEELGLIEREVVRVMTIGGIKYGNVQFVTPIAERVAEITLPASEADAEPLPLFDNDEADTPQNQADTANDEGSFTTGQEVSRNGHSLIRKGGTNTDISPESSLSDNTVQHDVVVLPDVVVESDGDKETRKQLDALLQYVGIFNPKRDDVVERLVRYARDKGIGWHEMSLNVIKCIRRVDSMKMSYEVKDRNGFLIHALSNPNDDFFRNFDSVGHVEELGENDSVAIARRLKVVSYIGI